MSMEIRALARDLGAHLKRYAETGVRGLPPGLPLPPGLMEPSAPAAPAESLGELRADLGNCERCRLSRGRQTLVFGVGNAAARVVFVGEAPGPEEDSLGEPFVGKAGALLTDIIQKGMKLRREDVYLCNIIKCRPPGNRSPEADEVESCVPFLARQIASVQPEVIVALGKFAAHTLLATTSPITRLRGNWGAFEGVPVMPTFHPSYLLRNPALKRDVWKDIQEVLKHLGLPA
ncbi:MAG: uracil-DNA glycosylase [Deltaproteobacteria bacterium]